MLLPPQVLPFVSHEDSLLREQAVRYFEHAHDVAPLTADDCWAAIDTVGLGRGAIGLILLLSKLPQSDASTQRLLAALDLPPDESMREWLIEALENLDLDQLRRHADVILARTDLPADTLDHLRARLDLADVLVAQRLWDQLNDHVEQVKDDYWNEIDHRVSDRLVEALARFGQDSTDRALFLIRNPAGADDLREIVAIDLLGRMRHRPALDLLIRTYAKCDEDDDVLHEALQDAIPQVGGTDAVAPLERTLPELLWGSRLYGIEMLARIKHPDAEAALLRLLDHPKLADSRDSIASALAELCTTDGLDRLRQIVLAEEYDAQLYDLKGELVACALMAAANNIPFDFPEFSTLREEVVAKEVEYQRRLEAGEFDLTGDADFDSPDDLDDDLTADDFADFPDLPPALDNRAPRATAPIRRDPASPGRNDPCPCGSGKKYKKCCLNKQA
jgi:HEAT repeat protein